MYLKWWLQPYLLSNDFMNKYKSEPLIYTTQVRSHNYTIETNIFLHCDTVYYRQETMKINLPCSVMKWIQYIFSTKTWCVFRTSVSEGCDVLQIYKCQMTANIWLHVIIFNWDDCTHFTSCLKQIMLMYTFFQLYIQPTWTNKTKINVFWDSYLSWYASLLFFLTT